MKYVSVVIIFIVFLAFEFLLDSILDHNFVDQANYWLSLFGFLVSLLLVAYYLTMFLNKKKPSEKA